MQRLRLRFSRAEEVKYISHLDLMRLWSRALRRAGIQMAHSEGFTPHPKISLAAPLPLGVTSEAELMDITLRKMVSPHFLMRAVGPQLPRGVDLLEVTQIPGTSPSVQSQLRHAEYHVVVKPTMSREDMQEAIGSFLRAESLPWHHMRDTGPRHYDLRALVDNVWLLDWKESACVLGMKLRCDPRGTGRPEQVITALGIPDYPDSIHRTSLILAGG